MFRTETCLPCGIRSEGPAKSAYIGKLARQSSYTTQKPEVGITELGLENEANWDAVYKR